MNIDKKLNAMRPKDTPLLVLGYIILGMFLFISPSAKADNEIFLDQTGDLLDLSITQSGADNLITSLTGSGTATVSGNNKTFTISQDGKNNTFKTWSHGGNQFLVADIIGDSNTLSMDNHGNNNKLYYWGTGDNNTAHMEIGNGGDNDNQIDLRQYGNNHYAYLETNDDNNEIDAFQGGGSNDGYLYIVSNGNSNDITAWQGKHSTGSTDGDETGDHDGYWIVNGNNNVLKSYQTDANRSNGSGAGHHFANYITGDSNTVTHTQKGKAGHDGFIEIDGDNNTVDLYQKGTNGVKWADLVLDGNGHSLDVTQKGGNNTSAAIDLTYGTAAYDFTLLQEATTGVLSYTITGTCVTAGGCTVSVTQSN